MKSQKILIEAIQEFFDQITSLNNTLQNLNNRIMSSEKKRKYLTLSETADYLKISKSYLYKLTSSNKIDFFKTGKKIYFKLEDLDEHISNNLIKAKMTPHEDDDITSMAKEYRKKRPLNFRK